MSAPSRTLRSQTVCIILKGIFLFSLMHCFSACASGPQAEEQADSELNANELESNEGSNAITNGELLQDDTAYNQYLEPSLDNPVANEAPASAETTPPSWVYGYLPGSFSGNTYVPGIYNFGSAATQGMQVYYTKGRECLYSESGSYVLERLRPGSHVLAQGHRPTIQWHDAEKTSYDLLMDIGVARDQEENYLVRTATGAILRPRGLMQDPIAVHKIANPWK